MYFEFDRNIKPILDVFDKIRELLKKEKIELPKIVVVGDQSSGKSSVLESITKISLPRGENTVTKCPIIIQLRSQERDEGEYGIVDFAYNDGTIEKSDKVPIEKLEEKIREYQEKLLNHAGVKITERPLNLRVIMKNVPDLTLYDLPGMTYSEQKITDKVRNIIREYIKGESTIVLLVIASNVDLTTSEGLALVKEQSNYKSRTIPILTKIDLGIADKNIFKTITRNNLDLAYNPVIVRNRTQQELEQKIPITDIYKLEESLIMEHPELKQLPKGTRGSRELIETLIDLQKAFLLNSRNSIRKQIKEKLEELKERKKKFPPAANTIDEKNERFKECLKLLSENLETSFDCLSESIFTNNELNITFFINKELEKVYEIFNKHSNLFLTNKFAKISKDMIDKSRGFNLPDYLNPKVFRTVISQNLKERLPNLKMIVDDCKGQIEKYLNIIIRSSFENYKSLAEEIIIDIKDELSNQEEGFQKLMDIMVKNETETMYTISPYYTSIIDDFNAALHSIKSSKVNSLTPQSSSVKICDFKLQTSAIDLPHFTNCETTLDKDVMKLQLCCFAYWKVIEKRFCDYFNIYVIGYFCNYFRDNLVNIIDVKYSPYKTKTTYIDESISLKNERRVIEESYKNLRLAEEELKKIS